MFSIQNFPCEKEHKWMFYSSNCYAIKLIKTRFFFWKIGKVDSSHEKFFIWTGKKRILVGNEISENHLCALPGPCMPSQQLWWLASARSSISKCFWLGPATEFRCLGLLKPYFIMCVWLLDTNITAKTQLELHVLYSSQHFCYLLYS